MCLAAAGAVTVCSGVVAGGGPGVGVGVGATGLTPAAAGEAPVIVVVVDVLAPAPAAAVAAALVPGRIATKRPAREKTILRWVMFVRRLR